MREFSVGDLVQVTGDESVRDGEVIAVTASKVQFNSDQYWRLSETGRKNMEAHATVKWTDGTQEDLSVEELEPRDSELEREFRDSAAAVLDKINDKLDEARTALSEAIKLSENHGVPFSAGISPLAQSYFPASFSEKFPGVDTEIVSNITGAYSEYPEYGGWQHSAVC
jgi:hypothetical protein